MTRPDPTADAPGMLTPLTPLATAAGIAGVTTLQVADWLDAGLVRSERIKQRVYVSLDDVLALAKQEP